MQQPTQGSLVRSLREQAGLSQEELAARAQVSRATVQNVERDRRSPRRAVLRRLAEALGVDAASLTPAVPQDATELHTELIGDLSEADDLDAIEDRLKAALAEIDRLRREREKPA